MGFALSHRDEDFNSELSGPGASGSPVIGRAEAREDRLNEVALFGEATYNLTQNWSLTAGARLFTSSHNVTAIGSGILFTSASPFVGSVRQDGFAPKLVLEYRPSDHVMFYAQSSEGYRLGGINVDGPPGATGEAENTFDSDELKELRAWRQARFLRHAAGYRHSRLLCHLGQCTNRPDRLQRCLLCPQRGNRARRRPRNGRRLAAHREILTLRGNFFWNNSGLANTNPLLANGEGVLPGALDISGEISARYDFPLTRTISGFTSAEYSYVGVSHLGFGENSQSMGGYRLANVRMGAERGSWQLGAFVDNLTNDRGNTFAFGNPFDLNRGPQVTPPRPRTIGVSLTWKE